jgi:TonB family protein
MADEAMERQDEQLPETIGRYEVQDALGYGAMGAVYKAFDPLIKRTLAIKTIRLDIPRASPEYKTFLERFNREARISGTLSHPNIVTLYDIGEAPGGTPFLAMEYVQGETIGHAIERGVKFEPMRVVGLVTQVASALDHAHSKGIVHRDVKPSNLILFENDRVKVTDFGIAKLAGAELTQAGQLLGTPSYMSPEQAMGEKLDGRSDIFSLGVCAFEMLSGEQPFPGNNVTSILYKLVHVDPVEPANLKMHGLIPEKWHEVFGKVLAKKPAGRYQTAAEFVRDLEYCLGSWDVARGPVASAAEGSGRTEAMPVATAHMPALAPGSSREASGIGSTSDSIPETLPERPAPVEALYPKTSVMPVLGGGESGGALDDGVEGTVAMAADELQPAMAPPAEDAIEETVSLNIPGVTRPEQPALDPPVDPADATVVMATDELAPTETRPTEQTPAAPARPHSRLPLGLVLGAAGTFFVVALGVAGFVVLRRGASEPTPQPTPLPPTVAPEPTPFAAGVLLVGSRPEGAAVIVDGEDRGTTPLELTGLGSGVYEVRLSLRGHRPQLESIEISEESPRAERLFTLTKVRRRPTTGLADVTSTPVGAAVSIDGEAVGESPVKGFRLQPGEHAVEISREGYESFSGTVTVVAGKTASLEARLEPIVVPSTPTPEPAVDTTRVYAEREVDNPPRKRSGRPSTFRPKLDRGETISVSISWVVDLEGRTTEVKVVQSGGEKLDKALVSAIRGWRYDPALERGVKVKVRLTRKYTYRTG